MRKSLILAALLPVGEACASCDHAGPTSPLQQQSWLSSLKQEREDALKTINYAGGVFNESRLAWTQTAYIQPQMHPYDRYFYDPEVGYTVDRYLDDLAKRHTKPDAILMWPTYTNIGADDRNQFDLFRTMPGGLEGVRNVTAQLHARGVHVLWPYNPWDHGTHREPVDDEHTFANLLKQTGGDGFNGDTMGFVPESFWTAAKAVDYPIAFEAEGGGTDASLNWSTMGWGYWSYGRVPVIDRFKFLTRGKFMTNVCDRWAKRKTDNLQSAWLSGAGYETWENVWGTWNGIVPLDGEAIRRVAAMSRFFGGKTDSNSFPKASRDFLHSPDWEPFAAGPMNDNVFASRFPLGDSDLYTIVNRGGLNLTGQQLWLPGPLAAGTKLYDCYRGVELKAETPVMPNSSGGLVSGYNLYQALNSFAGHGGTDIDNDPVVVASAEACAARCTSDSACDCVTYEPHFKNCWKRSACVPRDFDGSSSYDVYKKAQGYTPWIGRNGYSGHGAVNIDSNSVTGTQEQCQARCDADARCSCVTYKPSSKECWKRASCFPGDFTVSSAYNMYVKESAQPACASNCQHSVPPAKGAVAVSFDLESEGYACVLRSSIPASQELSEYLQTMQQMTQSPLYTYDSEWKYLLQTRVRIPATKYASSAPKGMMHIPLNSTWKFAVAGVEIEGDDSHGVDVQYPWDQNPHRIHSQTLDMQTFYIDQYPVTAYNYSDYLKATGFSPKDDYRWLKNWNGSRVPPQDVADLPVTYVSLKEARAFCTWRGARLPREHEWQYAAQGNDGRDYPWGSENDQSRYPTQTNGTVFINPESVFAHPSGASPFGVMDLVGNVWQYTDEFQDDHTRSVILRGGSNYRPAGSHWYFPQAKPLGTHDKYFLMDDRYERAGTIGFRCVVDASA